MIDPVAVQLGPVSIHWYGIIIDIAFIVGAVLAYNYAKNTGIDPEHVLNLIILVIPAALIGARLYYVVFNWEEYFYNPLEILATWHGGLAIHGGLLGGFLAGYLYIKKKKLDFWKMADIFAPSIILGQAIGRWGNFINQEAYGVAVSREYIARFPEFIQRQMFIGGQYHHPAFLYESVWNLLIFLILIIYRRREHFSGQILLIYLALYSSGRFFIEGLRTDSLMLGPLRAAQLASLLLIAAVGAIYFKKRFLKK